LSMKKIMIMVYTIFFEGNSFLVMSDSYLWWLQTTSLNLLSVNMSRNIVLGWLVICVSWHWNACKAITDQDYIYLYITTFF
jgi:hypothetical protein